MYVHKNVEYSVHQAGKQEAQETIIPSTSTNLLLYPNTEYSLFRSGGGTICELICLSACLPVRAAETASQVNSVHSKLFETEPGRDTHSCMNREGV